MRMKPLTKWVIHVGWKILLTRRQTFKKQKEWRDQDKRERALQLEKEESKALKISTTILISHHTLYKKHES